MAGTALFEGRDLLQLSDRELRDVRGKDVAMIFQDPMTSLNPVLTIGKQIREALVTHFDMDDADAKKRAVELLDEVGIPGAPSRVRDYPHQFSGGMRQRAMIAMALACKPKLLIADEPTTALDVTIQAQILDLLRALVNDTGMALIMITHDLGVVAGMCERVNVMYGGMFMESARPTSCSRDPATRTRSACCRACRGSTHAGAASCTPIHGAPRDMLTPPRSCPFAAPLPLRGRRIARRACRS